MPGALDGRSIIITGAASGIGAAAARLFAAAGAKLLLADMNAKAGEALARELTGSGSEARFVRTNVAEEADVAEMVAVAVAAFGRLDGAFNNAGIGYAAKPVHELDLADWQRTVDVNLTGVFLCVKHEIAAMLKTGGGAIVNTGSIASLVGLETAVEYVSSKHGVIGLTKTAALDYAAHGIRVNALLPGTTSTPLAHAASAMSAPTERAVQKPSLFDREADPMEIAAPALWLLSDASSFVTGAALTADGGYTVP